MLNNGNSIKLTLIIIMSMEKKKNEFIKVLSMCTEPIYIILYYKKSFIYIVFINLKIKC